MEIKKIATIYTDLPDKFGVPRQSGLASSLKGKIVMEPEYRNIEAFEGLLEFDRIWLIWEFEGVSSDFFRAKVRPPRLGGNEYKGVFATRSPFRPNPLGLTNVKLEELLETSDGPVLIVSGIDMKNGTAIYDIKPYLPYVESYPDAKGGFTDNTKDHQLKVYFADGLEDKALNIFGDKLTALIEILSQDPRPSYQNDSNRIYGLSYAGRNVKFRIDSDVVQICEIE